MSTSKGTVAVTFTDDDFSMIKRIKTHLVTCNCCRKAILGADNE